MSLISELQRRNVLRIAAAYVVTAWLVIQVAETILPIYGFSDAAIRYLITGLAVGLVPVLILAWAFELTPEGLKLDSQVDHSRAAAPGASRNFDRGIMAVLAIAIAYFAFDKFVLSESREAAIAEAAREEGRSQAVVEAYGERSIAVLAFDDMSPDNDQEYMSDGIAEEILNLLAKVPDLRVISRSSAFAFKGKDLPIPEIASQLNAAFILEGSVRKAGDQIRITAQLIEAGSDTHRWSETYDRELKNVFDIQDDIAAQVVEELKSTLLGNAPKSQRLDEEAYTLVLQARYFWWRRGEGDAAKALELFEQAVEIDPSYAPAWVGLVSPYLVAIQEGRLEREEGLAKANAAISKALELDPDNAEAYVRLGQLMSWDPDHKDDFFEQYEKAYELDPNNPLVLGSLALQAGREGRIDELVEMSDRAAALDPLGAIWWGNKAAWLIRFRRADEAEIAARKTTELNGRMDQLRAAMADIHNIRGEFDQALEALSHLPNEEFNLTRRAIALYGVGRVEESDAMLAMFEQVGIPEALLGIAQAHAMRGNNDLAFEYLERIRGELAPPAIVYDAYTRALTDDPRWKPYVDSLDWPWEYEY
jgi:TolB-like protein/Tfp pilus assembly protein PilF